MHRCHEIENAGKKLKAVLNFLRKCFIRIRVGYIRAYVYVHVREAIFMPVSYRSNFSKIGCAIHLKINKT